MLVVGLTGGIGSGKSTVAGLFAERGVPIIDTDELAREVVAPGMPGLQQLVDRFGNDILTADGQLDRAKLRERIFQDEAARRDVEAILHPRIEARVRDRLAALEAPYALVVIPLLAETGGYPFIEHVLVVDASRETQIRRVMERDGIDRAAVERILAAQADRQRRLALADDVIDGERPLPALRERVAQLDRRYREMARELEGR